MLTKLEREQLLRRWEQVQAELQAIEDLPVGVSDPAERERRLLEVQDVIECLFLWHFRAQESCERAAEAAIEAADRA